MFQVSLPCSLISKQTELLTFTSSKVNLECTRLRVRDNTSSILTDTPLIRLRMLCSSRVGCGTLEKLRESYRFLGKAARKLQIHLGKAARKLQIHLGKAARKLQIHLGKAARKLQIHLGKNCEKATDSPWKSCEKATDSPWKSCEKATDSP